MFSQFAALLLILVNLFAFTAIDNVSVESAYEYAISEFNTDYEDADAPKNAHFLVFHSASYFDFPSFYSPLFSCAVDAEQLIRAPPLTLN
ncbi:hypothetical protein C2869_07935 [Saccharobesus litoralis]|uniref:Uncharacterized protein n=1 Tax=Saccharobesus litoralis TaxID=2172099 RepID=A0A2S0VQ81_9ALTE|nr:hypothetical protein C2869_07935 [Saccharobesus litoralis]